jgi:hypothetical protein
LPDRSTERFAAGSDVIFQEAFRRFAIIGAAVAWTLSAVWALQQHWMLSGLLFLFGVVVLLLQRNAPRIGVVLAATLATALPSLWIVGIVFVTGGPAASRGVWLLLPPLVAGLIFQSRFARHWVLAYGAVVLILWVAEVRGFDFPDLIPRADEGYAYVVTGLTAFLATVGLTLTYASAQQAALDSVGSAHAHLDLVLRSLPEGVLAVQRERGPPGGYRALYGNPAMDDLLGGAITGLMLNDVTHERDTPFRERLLEHLDRAARTTEAVQDRIDFGSTAAKAEPAGAQPGAASWGRECADRQHCAGPDGPDKRRSPAAAGHAAGVHWRARGRCGARAEQPAGRHHGHGRTGCG